MDPLTTLAIVGTARRSDPEGACGSPAEAVLATLVDVPVEMRVLLAAGARAAAKMAGRASSPNDHPTTVSPPESLAACSPRAARIVSDLLAGHASELLPEALALLAAARQRLPHALLPAVLKVRGDDLRAAVRPVLGQRGAWLAAMNEAWGWARGAAIEDTIPALEAAWPDAMPAVRRDIFARARAIDPTAARSWLVATWSNEKADERGALLAAMRTNLSADDEGFVEAQLKDRASVVREAAQALLPRLRSSAFVSRMTARADTMLSSQGSMLTVQPPESVDAEAERDGLTKPPQGVGARAFWLTKVLAGVPLAHWTDRFGASPHEIVAAAETTDWASTVCEGWARAAIVGGESAWLDALLAFYLRADEKLVSIAAATSMAMALLGRMSSADAGANVEALFAGKPPRVNLATLLHAVPSPWSVSLGMRWVDAMRSEIANAALPPIAFATIRIAALALPAACFARALDPVELSEVQALAWERPLASFVEILRLRHDLVQEISP